jgi:hypothetical protein
MEILGVRRSLVVGVLRIPFRVVHISLVDSDWLLNTWEEGVSEGILGFWVALQVGFVLWVVGVLPVFSFRGRISGGVVRLWILRDNRH